MSFLLAIFKPLLKKKLLQEIERETTRDYLIKTINESFDVPGLTEAQEAIMLDRMYDAALKSIRNVIDRI